MKRPIIHNRYLSVATHRIFNGLMASAISISIGSWGWRQFAFRPIIGAIFEWLVYLSVPIGIAFIFVNPKHHSFVKGVAGEDGYNELRDKTD